MQFLIGARIISDQSRHRFRIAEGRARAYQRRNTNFKRNCVQETDRSVGGNVMVWASRHFQIMDVYTVFTISQR